MGYRVAAEWLQRMHIRDDVVMIVIAFVSSAAAVCDAIVYGSYTTNVHSFIIH